MSQNSLNILYEDSSLVVCAKPHGIATQSRNISTRDMESMLKTYLYQHDSQIKKNYPQAKEPYLAVIHRLDQPVSGILVFAKTPSSAKALNLQLQKKQFQKYYRALTTGFPVEKQGVLENYLIKNGRTNTSQICSRNTSGAKYARLEYQTVSIGDTIVSKGLFDPSAEDPRFFKSSDPNTAELEIQLDTGRHHQIRVQLAAIDCPIVGDTKYNSKIKQPAGIRNTRQFLHLCAFHLSFFHPVSGASMSFHLTEDILSDNLF